MNVIVSNKNEGLLNSFIDTMKTHAILDSTFNR